MRVLLIEDDDNLRNTLIKRFEETGYVQKRAYSQPGRDSAPRDPGMQGARHKDRGRPLGGRPHFSPS